jgi:hypothetical protein
MKSILKKAWNAGRLRPDLCAEKLHFFKSRDNFLKLKVPVLGGGLSFALGLWANGGDYLWFLAGLPIFAWLMDNLIRGCDYRILGISKYFFDQGDDYERFLRRPKYRFLGSFLFGDISVCGSSLLIYMAVSLIGFRALSLDHVSGRLLLITSALSFVLSALTEYFYFKNYHRLFPKRTDDVQLESAATKTEVRLLDDEQFKSELLKKINDPAIEKEDIARWVAEFLDNYRTTAEISARGNRFRFESGAN